MPRIAVTIDDLPCARHVSCSVEQQDRILSQVLEALSKARVKCLGFAVGSWVENSNARELMNSFKLAGHLVGNHGNHHKSLVDISIDAFEADLLCADVSLSEWIEESRTFRFPFLRLGSDPEKKKAALNILERHSYLHAPVTIDIEDWRYDEQFCAAVDNGNEIEAYEIIFQYQKYVCRQTAKFESVALDKLGYSPPHLLLLHMNMINAHCLSDTLELLRENGAEFVDPMFALADPLYGQGSCANRDDGVSWLYHVQGR